MQNYFFVRPQGLPYVGHYIGTFLKMEVLNMVLCKLYIGASQIQVYSYSVLLLHRAIS